MRYLLGLVIVMATAHAGVFSAISGMNMKELKTNHEYTVDTVGVNPRLYEFTPRSNPKYICVMGFTTASSGSSSTFQMQCFPKGK